MLVGIGQISLIESAIQTQEGYYPGSISYSDNNPGNLIASSWTKSQPGYVGTDSHGFAEFDNIQDGTAATDALIQNYANSGATISSMMAAWAPGSQAGNNPGLYAQNVATAAGVTPDTLVSDVIAGGGSGSLLASLGLSSGSGTVLGLSTDPASSSALAQSLGLSDAQLGIGAGVVALALVLAKFA